MLKDFLALFFPHYCAGCRRPLSSQESHICLRCDHEMPMTDAHLHEVDFITNKFAGKVALEDTMAYYTFSKGGRIQKILHTLKYHNAPDLGVFLGSKYGSILRRYDIHLKYDFIVPLPLHRSRHKVRGYNQSEKFADGLSQVMDIEVNTQVIARSIKTETQTSKSRIQRWKNVKDIFIVKDSDAIQGKRILLVDDVITTGSTLESCALALLEAGCQSVGIAAIAAAK